MSASEKRLARLISKLLANPQVLTPDGAGGFIGEIEGEPAIRLPRKLAHHAVTRGLLEPGGVDGVIATKAARSWVQRVLVEANASAPPAGLSFAAQHWKLEEREIFDPDGDLVLVQVNVADSPLLRLYRQTDEHGEHFLSAGEFAAGEKLRRDYASSTMGRMSASNWSAVRQGKSAARSASCADTSLGLALDGRQLVMKALAAVGPVLDRVLFSHLIREQGLCALEEMHHWPKRSGKVVLKIALSRLAGFYGLR